jgi:hypothetical protein
MIVEQPPSGSLAKTFGVRYKLVVQLRKIGSSARESKGQERFSSIILTALRVRGSHVAAAKLMFHVQAVQED